MPKRIVTALALAAVGIPAVIYGGIFYFLIMGAFLVGGAWEFAHLYRAVHYEPNEFVTVGGVLVIATARFFFAEYATFVFSVCILLAMTVHVIAYERGRDQAALDFTITVAGLVYMGWLGSYLIDLRQMPDGVWWFMLILPLIWGADTGAYSIGAVYGKHKMTPRLSPKKSWEGYVAGICTSIYAGALFAYAYSSLGPQPLHGLITPWSGALMGALISALTPLGDLGESMIKRLGGLKDSSNIFPGHGGILDRIDSWIWGAAIGYFIIQYFIL